MKKIEIKIELEGSKVDSAIIWLVSNITKISHEFTKEFSKNYIKYKSRKKVSPIFKITFRSFVFILLAFTGLCFFLLYFQRFLSEDNSLYAWIGFSLLFLAFASISIIYFIIRKIIDFYIFISSFLKGFIYTIITLGEKPFRKSSKNKKKLKNKRPLS